MGSGGSLERVLGVGAEESKTFGSGGSLVGLRWVLGKGPWSGSSSSEHQTEGLNEREEEKTSS